MQASAIEAPHARKKVDKDNSDHIYPSLSSDYAFMNNKNNEDKLTLYIIRERKSNHIFSTVVPRKGASETDVAVNCMLDWIAELGYSHHTVFFEE